MVDIDASAGTAEGVPKHGASQTNDASEEEEGVDVMELTKKHNNANDASNTDNINHEHGNHHHHNDHKHHDNHEHENNDEQHPTYKPTEEVKLEDLYNPNNLTWDELEMLLYEWEEEAATSVTEYLDMKVIHTLRTGEYDDDWYKDSEDEEEEEQEDKGSRGGGWLSKLKNTATHEDDGGKTQVVFNKRGPTRYLNLTDDAAHVVEFYAPWYETFVYLYIDFLFQLVCNAKSYCYVIHIYRCPHCQNYKWRYVEIAEEVKRRSITPGAWVLCSYHMCSFISPCSKHLNSRTQFNSMQFPVTYTTPFVLRMELVAFPPS